MSAPYRRSSGHALLWLFIVFSGIACSIALASVLPKDRLGAWLLAIFALPIIASMFVGWTILARIRRRRVMGLCAALEHEGFVTDADPSAERQAAVFEPVAALQSRASLRNGAKGILWLALRLNAPRSMCIFEHVHVTGSGKSTQEHLHTVIAWSIPGSSIGVFSAYRPRWLQGRALRQGGQVIAIGDDRFDRAWLVFGEAAAPQAFLTQTVRALLADSPTGESWHSGQGWIACVFDRALDAHNLGLFRRRCEEVVERAQLHA